MKNLDWLKEGFFAHRGFHNAESPENTYTAIIQAIKQGYHVEFDIQLTRDNQIIILHDQNLTRLCNQDINISESNYNDIKDLKINDTSHTVPLLKDVLNNIPSSTKLLIELKTSKRNKELVNEFISFMNNYKFTFVAMSFDPRIVYLLKKHPTIIRGYIKNPKHSKSNLINFFINSLPIKPIIKPDFIMHNIKYLPNKKMDKLYKKGIPVLSYTAKSQDQLDMIKGTYTNAVFEGFIPK